MESLVTHTHVSEPRPTGQESREQATRAWDDEMQLLGSIIIDPAMIAEIEGIITGADFGDEEFGRLFEAVVAQHRAGRVAVDAATAKRLAAEVGMPHPGATIGRIIQANATSANAVYYARRVGDAALKRRLKAACDDAARLADDDPEAGIELLDRLREQLRRRPSPGRFEFEPVTLAEFSRSCLRVDWLIDRVLVANEPMIIAAPKKSMKTSVLVDMAISLAIADGRWLGEFETQDPISTVFISAESSKVALLRKSLDVCKAYGIDAGEIENLHLEFRAPKFKNAAHLKATGELIEQTKAKVIIVDPSYFCLDGEDAGNLMVMGDQLKTFADVCIEAGATPILAHHFHKTVQAGDEPRLEHITWAGFQEYAAQWILMNRRTPYEPGSGHHELIVSTGGRISGGGLWAVDIDEGHYPNTFWETAVSSGGAAMQRMQSAAEQKKLREAAARRQRDKDDIAAILWRHYGKGEPQPFTKSMAREVADRAALLDTIADLVDAKKLKPVEGIQRGKNKQTYPGWVFVQHLTQGEI